MCARHFKLQSFTEPLTLLFILISAFFCACRRHSNATRPYVLESKKRFWKMDGFAESEDTVADLSSFLVGNIMHRLRRVIANCHRGWNQSKSRGRRNILTAGTESYFSSDTVKNKCLLTHLKLIGPQDPRRMRYSTESISWERIGTEHACLHHQSSSQVHGIAEEEEETTVNIVYRRQLL
ncbi:uncharacterized protein HD556DRAFT_129272 [Suillus plorans]|uniref:Uncharacterized protein n=1 Tax=Suillus plorans TaxID=116603 RepID=A0A9P7J2A8_9AGAM|nr:uncharacterized protein HD556DRAFT_129272 [Suillus plorans]KAG1799455.1 hypothetical protein HD556DRAFT_129272 [Suillus plorans]